MSNQTLTSNRSFVRRGSLVAASLLAAGALAISGASIANAAGGVSTGSYDGVEVDVNSSSTYELHTHAHSPSPAFNNTTDWFVIPSTGTIPASGALEVGLASSSDAPASTDLKLVGANFVGASGSGPADVEVWSEDGSELYFNTLAEIGQPVDLSFDIGSNFHDHPEWVFGNGGGDYTLTFQAVDSSNGVGASATYVLRFKQ